MGQAARSKNGFDLSMRNFLANRQALYSLSARCFRNSRGMPSIRRSSLSLLLVYLFPSSLYLFHFLVVVVSVRLFSSRSNSHEECMFR